MRWAHWYPEEEAEAHAMNANGGRSLARDFPLATPPATGSLEEAVREDARWEMNEGDEPDTDESEVAE